MRRKSGDKRTAILRAAVQVFAEEGYSAAKVARIAQVAGVATGSVYNYFEHKDDILRTVFREMWGSILGHLTEIAEDESLDASSRMHKMIPAVFETFNSDSNLARVFVNEQSFWMHRWEEDLGELYSRFMDILRDMLRLALGESELDPAILRYFVFGGVRQIIHHCAEEHLDEEKRRHAEEQAQKAILLLVQTQGQ